MNKFLDAMSAAGCAPYNADDVTETGGESRLIRGIDDKRGRKSLYYSLDGGFGHWYSCKTGEYGYWTDRLSTKEITPEERKRIKLEREARMKEIETARIRVQSEVAVTLASEWDFYSTEGSSPYLERKQVKNYGGRFEGDKLILPIVDSTWKIWGMQDIYADGAKYLRKDARKKGCFIPIGAMGDEPEVVYLCEGYATGATIHEAIGQPVIACIDAGNIMPVSTALRLKWPNAEFIFCADNDKWDKKTGEERDFNPGIKYAQEAASKIRGRVVYPTFDGDDKDSSDFNDLHVRSGIDAVRAALDTTSEIVAEPEEEYVIDTPPIVEDELKGDLGLPLRVLGYKEDSYFYYSTNKNVIVRLSPPGHTMSNLLQLATLDEWRTWISKSSGTMNVSSAQLVLSATDALMQLAEKRGEFSEGDRVRGSGAWLDNGRSVLHCGDVAFVDGVQTELHKIPTRYVYVRSQKLPRPDMKPLTSTEAVKLKELCMSLTWDNPLSGLLLSGWLVVAPICATLVKWRPHIWVTGESGSGKTTVLNQIIKPVLGATAFCFDGGTTEAALRDLVRYDGRPVVFDEAEPSPAMEGILTLARKASSASNPTAKFGQRAFKAQFCACFSAINPPIKDFADETRISVLALRKNRRLTAREDYEKLITNIDSLLTPEYSRALLARTVKHLVNLFENVKVFQKAATIVLKDSRSADQIAPMIAGLYLLHSTDVVTLERAEEWVSEHDWSVHTAIEAEPDHVRCLRHIMTYILRVNIGSRGTDIAIGDMIAEIHKQRDASNYYDTYLRMYGIRVIKRNTLREYPELPDGIAIASKSNHIERMLKGTPWQVNYAAALRKFEQVVNIKSVRYSSGSAAQASLFIPLSLFFGEE